MNKKDQEMFTTGNQGQGLSLNSKNNRQLSFGLVTRPD